MKEMNTSLSSWQRNKCRSRSEMEINKCDSRTGLLGGYLRVDRNLRSRTTQLFYDDCLLFQVP